MNRLDALQIIRKSAPNMNIEDAFQLIDQIANLDKLEITSRVSAEFRSQIEMIPEATIWAYQVFTPEELDEYMIQCVKRLRVNFEGLGLRAAKSIVDALRDS